MDMALKGNPSMIKLIMERVVPVKRSTTIKIPGMPKISGVADADKLTGFLLNSVAVGAISPLDCEIVSRVADKHLRALQVNDLEQRLYELEQLLEAQGKA